MNKLLEKLKARWLVLSQATVWLLSLFTEFVYAPPANVVDLALARTETGYNAARFGLTLVVAALFFAARHKWRRRWLWGTVAAVALLVAGFGYFRYQARLSDWTTDYNGGLVIHGETLTTEARAFALQHPIRLEPIDHASLLKYYAGNARDVWTDIDLINIRWRWLVVLYFATVAGLSLAVVAALQATRK